MQHRPRQTLDQRSRQHWSGSEPHHPVEVEHRFTVLEQTVESHSELHDAHRETQNSHGQRLSLIERAILGAYGSLYILAQDRFPELAALLKRMLP